MAFEADCGSSTVLLMTYVTSTVGFIQPVPLWGRRLACRAGDPKSEISLDE